jgi:hypothetical protein
MARRHQPPLTVEQIQREIDNWNSLYDSGLISYAEHQKAIKGLNTLLTRRKREVAQHSVSPEAQEQLDRTLKRLRERG